MEHCDIEQAIFDNTQRVGMDEFDIEQAILAAWSTDQDIDTLLWRLQDCPDGSMSEDDLANYLLAIKHMLNLRCEKLLDVYRKTFKLDHYRNLKDED